MGIVLGDIAPASHNIGRAHPIDATAFRYGDAGLDYPSARLDPIARINMIVIGAICQGKTKGSASRNRRKPSPRRACSTPHHPPPAPGTIEFEHGQIVAKIGRRGRTSERIISPEFCFVHTPNDTPTPLPRLANASPLDVTAWTLAELLGFSIQLERLRKVWALGELASNLDSILWAWVPVQSACRCVNVPPWIVRYPPGSFCDQKYITWTRTEPSSRVLVECWDVNCHGTVQHDEGDW